MIGRFLDAHSFDDARNENGTECIGKRIDRAFEHRANFTLGHALLRIAAGRQGRKVDDFRLLPIGPVSFPIHSRTPAPQSSERLVHRDARDPRAEGRIAAKHVEAGEGEHVGLLHDVLGFRVVTKNAPGNAEQAAIVPLGDDADAASSRPRLGGPGVRPSACRRVLAGPASAEWAMSSTSIVGFPKNSSRSFQSKRLGLMFCRHAGYA